MSSGPSKHPNTVSATLQLPPGTHHVKFLVNNDMVCSPHLPTTVDFTNILVNYIEVSSTVPSTAPAVALPTAPSPVPSRPLDIRPKQVPDAVPQGRPSSPKQKMPAAAASPATTPARASPRPAPTPPPTSHSDARPAPSPSQHKKQFPSKTYTTDIPAYLIDLDNWPPQSESADHRSPESNSAAARAQHAASVCQNLPAPPSFPLFLSRSILNLTTPNKDDSSVLAMPNHTVLNHLATTNIRQGVLAVSATTRYKKKVYILARS